MGAISALCFQARPRRWRTLLHLPGRHAGPLESRPAIVEKEDRPDAVLPQDAERGCVLAPVERR
ncbi:hypothetical protein D3C71_1736710 [compost metagenome]